MEHRSRHAAPLPAFHSRYERLVRIGSGGTASVFVGRTRGANGFSRLVALKLAHPRLVDDSAALRLETEARLAAPIHHANVVAVHDVERQDGDLVLVMEYVEGGSLDGLIEAGRLAGSELPYPIGIRVVLDACAGLAAVHELTNDAGEPVGVVHCNVSPKNVLVGIDGAARITDFGLARLISTVRENETSTGNLAYQAPELIDGRGFSVQSDVFAMGVMLWETLARERLLRGSSEPESAGSSEPPPLSWVAPELGPFLDDIVAKALAKDPKQRYRSVRELSIALERAASRFGLIATSADVSLHVRSILGHIIALRRRMVRRIGDDAELNRATPSGLHLSTQELSPSRSPSLPGSIPEGDEDTGRHPRVILPPPRTPPRRAGRASGAVAHVPAAPESPPPELLQSVSSDIPKHDAPSILPTMLSVPPPSFAARSRWRAIGFVVAPLALAVVLVSRWFDSSPVSATTETAQTAAPAMSVSPIPVANMTATSIAAPSAALVTSPSAATSARKRVLRPKTVSAPAPEDTEEPVAAPSAPADDAPPTNTDPLARAKRRPIAEPNPYRPDSTSQP